MSNIHSTAIINTKAELGSNVKVGPYCVIGENLKINDGTELISHVVLDGRTTIGANCRIYPFASIGHCPQDAMGGGRVSVDGPGNGPVVLECLEGGVWEGVDRVGADEGVDVQGVRIGGSPAVGHSQLDDIGAGYIGLEDGLGIRCLENVRRGGGGIQKPNYPQDCITR